MIISASRRTDIPAFYSEWFLKRLKEGFLYVKNPFNANQISKIDLSPNIVECIVFWSKNPESIIRHLQEINELGYKYYFQFTVTSYDKSIELYVPKKEKVISTFKKLADNIGPDKVIWRYDPILLTDKFNYDYHVKWFEYLAKKLSQHTKKCVISFIDMYKKCERNLSDVHLNNIDISLKNSLANSLSEIAKSYNLLIQSCAEEDDFSEFNIPHGKCIDDDLISKIIGAKIDVNKDKTQRKECCCVTSIDIGAYNTCKHGCKYCYANYSQKTVNKNCHSHDVNSPLLAGVLTGNEKITTRKMVSFLNKQKTLF